MVIEISKGREARYERGGRKLFILILPDSLMEIVLIFPGIDCGLHASVLFARLVVTSFDKSLLSNHDIFHTLLFIV